MVAVKLRGAAPFRRQEVAGVGVAWECYVMPRCLALMDSKTDGGGCPHLNRRDADLAIALSEMAIAGGVEAAWNRYGDEEAGAGRELLGVDVAAVFTRRDGAQALVGDLAASGHGIFRIGRSRRAATTHIVRFAGGPGFNLCVGRGQSSGSHE